jgi:putative intracellular protease/amidase
MKILMVLSSHEELGITGRKTGFWLEALAAPYYVFKDYGAEITLASPKGGQPPLDPKSGDNEFVTEATERFRSDNEALSALADTVKLSDIFPACFDALFYPGGQGLLWDLAEDKNSIALIETMFAQGKLVAAVSHAPGVFRHAKAPDGSPLVQGKSVTGFANSQETIVGTTDVEPFLVEDELKKNGGNYSKGSDWQPYVVRDDNLITGQNPASSVAAAQAVLGRSLSNHGQT